MGVWKDEYVIRIYELVREGKTRREVAAELGTTPDTLKKWRQTNPLVQHAIDRGLEMAARDKARREAVAEPFDEYIFKRLSPDLQDLWSQITRLDTEPNPEKLIDDLLATRNQKARQSLWVHAFVCNSFNKTEACRLTGVSFPTVQKWAKDSPAFARLLVEMREVKKDWVEGQLMKLVAAGETAAVIFANRTLNGDRGYNPKITVKHEGGVVHGHVNLEELPLDLDTRRKMLAAIREQEQRQPPRLVEAQETTNGD